jgi:RNA polymerase sigma-70 factor (ECF subfamily)
VSPTGPNTGKLLALRRVGGKTREMSDDALVAACGVGETAALGALFDRHHRDVYRFLSRLATTNADDVDDLVQTTFLEAWRSARRFRRNGAVRSWIYGIAVNVARHYVRGEVRRRAAHQGFADCERAHAASPASKAEHRELVTRIEVALRELPHDQRVAFVMCDLEGIAGVDAARALGIRRGTMWRRLHDARKALRSVLAGSTL